MLARFCQYRHCGQAGKCVPWPEWFAAYLVTGVTFQALQHGGKGHNRCVNCSRERRHDLGYEASPNKHRRGCHCRMTSGSYGYCRRCWERVKVYRRAHDKIKEITNWMIWAEVSAI
jgi:hypothetical protein